MRSDRHFDICIIGTGPAGAFAAHELSQRGYRVAVLEAGGAEVDADPANVIDLEASSIGGRVNLGLSQQVGGASNLWAGALVRINQVDLIARPEFGSSEWPISMSELQSYYARVDTYLGIRRQKARARELLENAAELSAFQLQEILLLEPPFATGPLVRDTPAIELFEDCPVHKVVWDERHSSIREVEFFDRAKKRHRRLRARIFVLAAGAFTNIRILLYSLAERKRERPPYYDQIGRGFSTHPKADIGHVLLTKQIPWNHPFVNIARYETHGMRYQCGLNAKLLLERGLLNHCLRFNTPYHGYVYRRVQALRNTAGRGPVTNRVMCELANKLTRLGVTAFQVRKKMRGTPAKLTARIFLNQAARPDNRLVLSSRRSESGLPLAALHWRFTEEDWRNAEAFIEAFATELRRANIGELIYQRPGADKFIAIHSHFLGGTPMGTDPGKSVVDPDLRVHGIENLYVSGPSVFPSYGFANPFYTIAGLSLRLGDHLAARLRNSTGEQYAGPDDGANATQ
jgi:choline dehydrogenase-like flavoprotein